MRRLALGGFDRQMDDTQEYRRQTVSRMLIAF